MPDYVFNKTDGLYRVKSTGRAITERELYQWVEDAVTAGGKNLERFARQLQGGEIDSVDWAISTGEEIRNMHRAVAMIASGGKQQMSHSDWGFVGARIREQLSYFNRFASEVDNIPDGAKLTDAFVARAKSYHHAAYETFAKALRRRIVRDGQAQFEENQLEAGAEHCEGCLAASAEGRVPVGTLTPVGDRECGSRCLCRIIYVREAA